MVERVLNHENRNGWERIVKKKLEQIGTLGTCSGTCTRNQAERTTDLTELPDIIPLNSAVRRRVRGRRRAPVWGAALERRGDGAHSPTRLPSGGTETSHSALKDSLVINEHRPQARPSCV